MRQKCDYCGSNPEVPKSGNCPNCGAVMPIFMDNCPNYLLETGAMSVSEARRINGYPRPTGSAYNPTTGGLTGTPRPFDDINMGFFPVHRNITGSAGDLWRIGR